ncbi:heat shock protein transcriptional repressor HspR [Actinomyces culturomici]|uniref:heat shock protein transcriptional repressor HspR n=1 Tax=Actinomyces culturomici TaxID=1926276 RepID=UPI000E204EAE|nr:helix-turn-helix transcriptional regulator [Actinomyces culturomici]
MARRSGGAEETLTFVISVAAELAGMHPQTLRQYDRLGLVSPARAKGRGRRYTKRDIQRLRDVQRMSQEEGINLAGIQRILELERRVERLEAEREALRDRLEEVEARRDRVFAASPTGVVSPIRRGERPWSTGDAQGSGGELDVWRPWRAQTQYRPERRIRAVIEAGPHGVRVVDGTVSVVQ